MMMPCEAASAARAAPPPPRNGRRGLLPTSSNHLPLPKARRDVAGSRSSAKKPKIAVGVARSLRVPLSHAQRERGDAAAFFAAGEVFTVAAAMGGIGAGAARTGAGPADQRRGGRADGGEGR